MYQWHEKEYLGAAHGVAGILFLLLKVCVDLFPSKRPISSEGRTRSHVASSSQLCEFAPPSDNRTSEEQTITKWKLLILEQQYIG